MNRRRWSYGWLISSLLLSTGCGDPIYDLVEFDLGTEVIQLTPTSGGQDSEWPQTNGGEYVVVKPPPMAYLTSFSEKLSRPDPTLAQVVPWSDEGLDDRLQRFLHQAYDPFSETVDVRFEVHPTDPQGKLGMFDVSSDGTRLVVIDANSLAIYRTEDGSLIERLKLPPQDNSSPPFVSVKFAGSANDMLVASTKKIVRINGQDGALMAQCKGCGDSISSWRVSYDDKSMLMLSKSGRLFLGKPDLSYFTALDVGEEAEFTSADLSPDGKRLGVVHKGRARTYTLSDFRVVDQVDYSLGQFYSPKRRHRVVMGDHCDAWIKPFYVFSSWPEEESRNTDSYELFWQMLAILPTEHATGTSCLLVAQRVNGKTKEAVLADFNPRNRAVSRPQRLREYPHHIACDETGSTVAIRDSKGLQVVKREVARDDTPWDLKGCVYDLLDNQRFDQLEKVLAIIASQDRLGFGRSSERLRSQIINAMAARWRYLGDKDPDDDRVKALEAWRQEGSLLAITVSGVRHRKKAWEARGSGFAHTVTANAGDIFTKHVKLAIEELDRALEFDDPPLTAFDTRIAAQLDLESDLASVNELCRRSTERFPGETSPHASINFKLLPQWYGDPGDAASFPLAVGRLMEGRQGDMLYVRLLGRISSKVNNQQNRNWHAYDANRVRRGVEEIIRTNTFAKDELWALWADCINRQHNLGVAELILGHLMKHSVAAPYKMTHEPYWSYSGEFIPPFAQRIRTRASDTQ